MLAPAPLLALALLAAPPSHLKLESPPVPKGAVLTRASPEAQVGLTLGLPMRDPAVLEQLITLQHDPASPLYRRWLTPQEFGARFGQSDEIYEGVARPLVSAGLRVDRFPDRILMHATGTVAQVEKLFGIALYDVTIDGDLAFRTFRGTVRLPGAMAANL